MEIQGTSVVDNLKHLKMIKAFYKAHCNLRGISRDHGWLISSTLQGISRDHEWLISSTLRGISQDHD